MAHGRRRCAPAAAMRRSPLRIHCTVNSGQSYVVDLMYRAADRIGPALLSHGHRFQIARLGVGAYALRRRHDAPVQSSGARVGCKIQIGVAHDDLRRLVDGRVGRVAGAAAEHGDCEAGGDRQRELLICIAETPGWIECRSGISNRDFEPRSAIRARIGPGQPRVRTGPRSSPKLPCSSRDGPRGWHDAAPLE